MKRRLLWSARKVWITDETGTNSGVSVMLSASSSSMSAVSSCAIVFVESAAASSFALSAARLSAGSFIRFFIPNIDLTLSLLTMLPFWSR